MSDPRKDLSSEAPVIRCAVDEDGEGIAELICAVFREYEGCVFDREAEFPELDAVATHFAGRQGAVWVAVQSECVVGSIAVAWMPHTRVHELLKLYVAMDQRGGGLAPALLDRALGFVADRGAQHIELWTDTRFTRAHRFYERHGFRFTGRIRELGDLSGSKEFHYVRDGVLGRP
ncbi:MAG: GNAT family N-acetyltransferase [Geminicoccaceae bacterium]